MDGHRHLAGAERLGQHLDLWLPHVVDIDQRPPGLDNRNRMPWTRLFLVHHGGAGASAVHDLAARRQQPLVAGTLLLLPPERGYRFLFSGGLRMFAAHFRLELGPGNDACAGIQTLFSAPVPSGLAELALRAAASDGPAGAALARAVVLAGAAAVLPATAAPCLRRAALAPLLEAIDRRLSARLAVGALAAEFGVHRAHLHRLMVAAVGASPREHLHRRLAQRAGALLLEGWAVQQVAAELGFSSPFAFSRFFRSRTGQPPSRFRAGL
jgi:AraC-like DNA-binding protein